MNKQTILSSILSVALLSLTACSSDKEESNGKEINTARSIEFKVNFSDYNDGQEVSVTRTTGKETKAWRQTIDLGNGVLAQCTLQRDTTKRTTPAATRAMPNDTYTMLAYDAATHSYKGEVTGTVTSNVFTATSPNHGIMLAPGNYDFVLFNSKVSRSGDQLTVTRSNADAALIGRTTQYIAATPERQRVAFFLRHAGAQIRIKLTGYMDFPGVAATIASVNATDVPGSATYDASTDTWTAGTGAALSANTTYHPTIALGWPDEGKYGTDSNEAMVLLPTTDVSKLKLKFTSGNIYKENMANAGLTFSPSVPLHLEQNGYYILKVNLMYNFLYLMSDGTTGFFPETTYGGGTKTPIGVVVSRSKRMAIALKNAANLVPWTTNITYDNNQVTTDPTSSLAEMLTRENGYEETWDGNYSNALVTGEKVKGKNADFTAFKYAADYTPGVPVTGTMVGKKWHLPALGEWKYVFTALALGDITLITGFGMYTWNRAMANSAFKQVGGDEINNSHSATEYNLGVGFFDGGTTSLIWSGAGKPNLAAVRPFIRY